MVSNQGSLGDDSLPPQKSKRKIIQPKKIQPSTIQPNKIKSRVEQSISKDEARATCSQQSKPLAQQDIDELAAPTSEGTDVSGNRFRSPSSDPSRGKKRRTTEADSPSDRCVKRKKDNRGSPKLLKQSNQGNSKKNELHSTNDSIETIPDSTANSPAPSLALTSVSTSTESVNDEQKADCDPLFYRVPYEIRRKIFGYCIPAEGLKCREELTPDGEVVLGYDMDKTALSMVLVCSRWFGELATIVYKNVTFVISGRTFTFDKMLDKAMYLRITRNDEPIGHRDTDLSDELKELLSQRLNAKCGLLTGSSRSEPRSSPFLRYIQNLTFLIDTRQFDHDWLFQLGNGQQAPLPKGFPAEKKFFDNDESPAGQYASQECRGRVQGRLSIHSQIMDNICQLLEKSQPLLQSVNFEMGYLTRESEYDGSGEKLKNSCIIPHMGDRKCHLEETLSPFMVSLRKLEVVKITTGPNMKSYLADIQQWQARQGYQDQNWLWGGPDLILTTTVPDNQKLDYRYLFEEIAAKASTLKATSWLEMADITELGSDLKDLVRSFSPHPRNSNPNWCSIAINTPYHLGRETYEDVLEIEHLISTKPTLSSVRSLRRRVYKEITPRYEQLRIGFANFIQTGAATGVVPLVHHHEILKAFLFSFSMIPDPIVGQRMSWEDIDSLPISEQEQWDPLILDRARAWKELTNSYNECMVTTGKSRSTKYRRQYRELSDELKKHFFRIQQAWDRSEKKYGFLDELGELPQVRGIEYPVASGLEEGNTEAKATLRSNVGAPEPEKDKEDYGKEKFRRTVELDAVIQRLVNQGNSQEAWILLKVLIGDTQMFSKDSLPPKAKPTVRVAPMPRLLDRPIMKLRMPVVQGPAGVQDSPPVNELAYNMTMAEVNEKMVAAGINMSYEVSTSCNPDEFRGAVGIEAFSVEMLEIAKEEAERRFSLEQKLRESHRKELIAEGYGV